MTNLTLSSNQISDISALSRLNRLTGLNLDNNQISNIYPLTVLTNLDNLNIGTNKVSDIRGLQNLTSLTVLKLNGNQILDISSIGLMESLKTLWLQDNNISDISDISNLVNLSHLDLGRNQISNISSINNLTTLNVLKLDANAITDVSSISNLVNLIELRLDSNNLISDISALSGLINLTSLKIENNQISDVNSLRDLTKLTSLNIYNNQVSDIHSLSKLTNLSTLILSRNEISDISPLKDLTKLRELRLEYNNISNISSLQNMLELSWLQLNNNEICDIKPLANLSKLTHLYLSNNQISDVTAFKKLTLLKDLQFSNNRVFDMSPLEGLGNLSYLNISSQSPILVTQYKTKYNSVDVLFDNPIIGIYGESIDLYNISNGGIYEKGELLWTDITHGEHIITFKFLKTYDINGKNISYNGTATLIINVDDIGAPEPNHVSEFNNSDYGIYVTINATDLGIGVSHLVHDGRSHDVPYKFKYDAYNPDGNKVEVYDLKGNMCEYEVKLNDSDYIAIDNGLNALISEPSRNEYAINYFRAMINGMNECTQKDLLQDKLNLIFPQMEFNKQLVTANLDIYIKSESLLSLSLSNNSISFNDFNGTEDLEQANALKLNINSSLPYEINAYLKEEIYNSNKSETMDKSILGLKESGDSKYKEFTDINTKLVLLSHSDAGNDKIHNFDFKLNGGIAHKKDVYKTTVKFEVNQK